MASQDILIKWELSIFEVSSDQKRGVAEATNVVG
jgi:hypothetical protein